MRLFGRRGRLNWYDLVFLVLALVIVYPDTIREKISEAIDKPLGFRSILLLELLALSAMAFSTWLLMPHYPNLEWWHPAAWVGIVALFRALHAFLVGLFD